MILWSFVVVGRFCSAVACAVSRCATHAQPACLPAFTLSHAGGCLFSLSTILLRGNRKAMLAVQGAIGVGTLAMGVRDSGRAARRLGG